MIVFITYRTQTRDPNFESYPYYEYGSPGDILLQGTYFPTKFRVEGLE